MAPVSRKPSAVSFSALSPRLEAAPRAASPSPGPPRAEPLANVDFAACRSLGPDAGLVAAIRPLADAYAHWLDRQEARINAGADGIKRHNLAVRDSLRVARGTLDRLRAGIDLLGTDATAAETSGNNAR